MRGQTVLVSRRSKYLKNGVIQSLAIFEFSSAKPNLDKHSKTGRLNLARYSAGNQVRPKFPPKSRKHIFGLLLTFGIIGVILFWTYVSICQSYFWLLKLWWQAFFSQTPEGSRKTCDLGETEWDPERKISGANLMGAAPWNNEHVRS